MRIASLLALLGTAVLFVLGALLHGLVGTAWDLSSCALGAFVGTWLANRSPRTTFRGNLGPAAIVVFVTFVYKPRLSPTPGPPHVIKLQGLQSPPRLG